VVFEHSSKLRAGIYNRTFEKTPFYSPMPIPTVKNSSPGYAIDDLPLGRDIHRRGSNARPLMPVLDTAFAALPLGCC
jgi:hypothetical protein